MYLMRAFHNHPQMVDHNYIQHNTVVTPPHAIFRNTEYRKRSRSKPARAGKLCYFGRDFEIGNPDVLGRVRFQFNPK